MMKTVYFFIKNYIDENTGNLIVGGVETYARDLAQLALSEGFKVVFFQFNAICRKKINYEGCEICFEPINRKKYQSFFDQTYIKYNNKALFIIMSDQLNISSKCNNVISIQHGIAFDIPGYMIRGIWGRNKALQHVNKLLRCLSNLRRGYMCKNIVLVDYNFYNWFRTIGTYDSSMKVTIIPNYTRDYIDKKELENKLQNNNIIKKILFARRFCDYRGVFLFSSVIKRLLKEIPNIEITFAGSGPLESIIINCFKDDKRVRITRFQANESISFHKEYDIAVVPTIFSEGTSLSLIEAMGAGCLPIATHVGGMTNIILDHFNGLFCSPNEESLYLSLKEAINMPKDKFNEIVYNAYNSARFSFSIDLWKERWKQLLNSSWSN